MDIFPIPWEETLEGCRLSIENAERLVEDSQILKRNGRIQSAYSVSLDAWEELGKAILLYRYYKTKEPVSSDDWKRILRDHKRKRVAWVNSMDLLYGTTIPKSVADLKQDLERTLHEEGSSSWFNLERDVGVYVDWVGGEHGWRSPCKIGYPWFESEAWMRPLFDSDYWAANTRLICDQLKETINRSEVKPTSSS